MITLDFPGIKPAAKARPRVTGNGTYMPHDYKEWKRQFAYTAQKEWWRCLHEHNQHVPSVIACPVSVSIIYRTTSGNMRPDVDNAAGAVLDALQDAGIIANDSQVRRLLVEVIKVKKPQTGITVTIEELTA